MYSIFSNWLFRVSHLIIISIEKGNITTTTTKSSSSINKNNKNNHIYTVSNLKSRVVFFMPLSVTKSGQKLQICKSHEIELIKNMSKSAVILRLL